MNLCALGGLARGNLQNLSQRRRARNGCELRKEELRGICDRHHLGELGGFARGNPEKSERLAAWREYSGTPLLDLIEQATK
jgi:hypothetical protein